MIEINLLPPELRSKAKRAEVVKPTGKQPVYLLYIIPALLAILVCVHVYVAVTDAVNGRQLSSLNDKWKSLEQRRKEVAEFKKEFDAATNNINTIQQLTGQRINYAEKLNKLSLYLPKGVWFVDLVLDQKNMVLKGSVVSLQKEEFNLINGFIDSLKKDYGFIKDFNSLELSSIQRRVIVAYDIVDFILTGTQKAK